VGGSSVRSADATTIPTSAIPVSSPSFLFQINELPINDDPDQGGVAPRANDNGRWVPPIYSNGFGPKKRSRLYRWTDGTISVATDCQWYNGEWWSSTGEALEIYRTTTMGYCNPWAHFLTATGDASTRHMALSADPDNRWWPLTFRHNGALSRVEEIGEEQYLAGTGAAWIDDFGLGAYSNRHAPASGGLSGNLAALVALIAFSCKPDQLDNVLIADRAWRHHRWRGHYRPDGRKLNTMNAH
jgi:hypothetical protein